jgi:lipopolysaccharide export system protein LptC
VNAREIPFLPLTVLTALVAFTFWLNQFVQPPTSRIDSKIRHDPDLVIENLSAQALGETGEVLYTVKAKQMLHFPDDDSSTFEVMTFTARHPNLPPIIAMAPRGRLLSSGDEIMMEGGVVVTSAATATHPALKLTTPIINFIPDKNLVRATEGVQLESPGSTITAAKMEMNSLTRTMRMERFRGVYMPPKLIPTQKGSQQ